MKKIALINRKKIFGFEIFRLEKESFDVLRLENLNNYFLYPGLYTYFDKPELEYDDLTIIDDWAWKRYAYNSIYFTILNLLFNKIIEIHHYEEHLTYLKGFFVTNTNYYTIRFNQENLSASLPNDILSHELLEAMQDVEYRFFTANNGILEIIKRLTDQFLKDYLNYQYPEKQFLIAVLNRYLKFPWFKLSETKKLKGIYKAYKFKMEEPLFTEQKYAYHQFRKAVKKLETENPQMAKFKNYIIFKIEKDFRSRYKRGG